VARVQHRRQGRGGPDEGFTLIEIMISLTVLLIGIVGILALQVSITREGAFSRHTTEASVVGEQYMEILMVRPTSTYPASGASEATTFSDVDSQGVADNDGPFEVASSIVTTGSIATLEVTITWQEHGDDYTIALTNMRVIE